MSHHSAHTSYGFSGQTTGRSLTPFTFVSDGTTLRIDDRIHTYKYHNPGNEEEPCVATGSFGAVCNAAILSTVCEVVRPADYPANTDAKALTAAAVRWQTVFELQHPEKHLWHLLEIYFLLEILDLPERAVPVQLSDQTHSLVRQRLTDMIQRIADDHPLLWNRGRTLPSRIREIQVTGDLLTSLVPLFVPDAAAYYMAQHYVDLHTFNGPEFVKKLRQAVQTPSKR